MASSLFSSVYVPPSGPQASLDARLASNSEDQLVASLRNIRLDDNDLPVRPDFGTVGKVIKLRTNFFPISIPKRSLYEYDVAIAPAGLYYFWSFLLGGLTCLPS